MQCNRERFGNFASFDRKSSINKLNSFFATQCNRDGVGSGATVNAARSQWKWHVCISLKPVHCGMATGEFRLTVPEWNSGDTSCWMCRTSGRWFLFAWIFSHVYFFFFLFSYLFSSFHVTLDLPRLQWSFPNFLFKIFHSLLSIWSLDRFWNTFD